MSVSRLDQHVELALPDMAARRAIAKHHLSRLALTVADTADPYGFAIATGTVSDRESARVIDTADVFSDRVSGITAGACSSVRKRVHGAQVLCCRCVCSSLEGSVWDPLWILVTVTLSWQDGAVRTSQICVGKLVCKRCGGTCILDV